MSKDNDLFILDKLNNSETFEEGFNLLVNTYKERLYWHINKITENHEDTDEVLQQTFIKVFRYIKNFRNDSKLYTWLYRIATNEAIYYSKKNKWKNRNRIELDQLNQSTVDINERSSEEILNILNNAIETLPVQQRKVFIYRYYDELSYNEIAEIMNLSEGGLKANYHHAVKKVEAYIKKKY